MQARGLPAGQDWAVHQPVVRPISAAETRPLRHRVLRPGQPFGQTSYPRDDHPETVHLGAFDGDRLVGIVSLYREARPDRPDRSAWRMRGLATEPDVRGRKFGTAMMAASIAHVAGRGGGELWCNARLEAVGFYEAAGFEVDGGEPFEIAGIGPHLLMRRPVAPADQP